MSRLLASVLLTLTFGFIPPTAQGQDPTPPLVLVGLPAHLTPSTAESVKAMTSRLFDELPVGSRIVMWDAWRLQYIAEIIIPEAASKPQRQKRIAKQLGPFGRYLQQQQSVRSEQPDAIRMADFLRTAAATVREPQSGARIILIGDPQNVDEARSPATVFGPDEALSPGHVLQDPGHNIFGTAGQNGLLGGVSVHYWYLGPDQFANPQAGHHTARLYAFFVDGLGGTLATFSPSHEQVARRAVAGLSDRAVPETINPDDKAVEVRRYTARRAARPTPPVNPPVTPVSRNPQPQTVEQALTTTADRIAAPVSGGVKIAAVWVSQDPNADVDLWVVPRRGSDELSFGNVTSDGGRYLRDIRHAESATESQDWVAKWEVVELDAPVEHDQVRAWLNVYQGNGSKIQGLVRILDGNHRTDLPFSFNAKGDNANNRHRRGTNPAWQAVALSEAFASRTSKR